MTKILVTGGTGVLGREVVTRLRATGEHPVAVLTRRAASKPGQLTGDLETGQGLAAAIDGASVIVHCASSADYRRPWRDVEATRRLLDAARPTRPHLVYISIVGVDRIEFGYYRAKLAAEQLIEGSGLPWTILRTTQFHDLILMFLRLLTPWPVALLARGQRSQPVDVTDVADRMAELAVAEPAGRVPDLGGPVVETGEDLLRTFLTITGRRRLPVPVPFRGRLAAGFRAGAHLVGEGGQRGTRTFAEYLRARVREQGDTPPYRLRRR